MNFRRDKRSGLMLPYRHVPTPRERQRGMIVGYARASASGYIVDAARFEDTGSERMTRTSLTGAADSKLVTGVVFCKSADIAYQIFSGSVSGVTRFGLSISSDNFRVIGRGTTGTLILDVESTGIAMSGSWRGAMFSFDMADTGKRHLYIGDTSSLSVSTYTDAVIDFTMAEWSFGATFAGSGNAAPHGDYADFSLWPGQYLDLSVESNRRLLMTAAGRPENPAAAIAALGTPLVRFHLDNGEAPANFAVNRGSGGDFSITGTLSTADDSPSD